MIDDNTFNELKNASIEIWKTYDDTYGYATEKIERVESISNVSDNYGTFIGMFDGNSQDKLFNTVGDEVKVLITDWTGGCIK